MPEGPELHLAARFITTIGKRTLFGGQVVKSEVSTKNPDVPWNKREYRVKALSRGKELKVTLTEGKEEGGDERGESMDILFRFGMSGSFKFTTVEEMPKHAHLQFYSTGQHPAMVLSFMDYRRFGRWEVGGHWGSDRGPDPLWEYPAFRSTVLASLDSAAFNRPICETMLNQRFFNGIGNYMRAEVLYRCGVRPFDEAREVLSGLKPVSEWYEKQLKEEEIKEGNVKQEYVKEEDMEIVKEEKERMKEKIMKNVMKEEEIEIKKEDIEESILKSVNEGVKQEKIKENMEEDLEKTILKDDVKENIINCDVKEKENDLNKKIKQDVEENIIEGKSTLHHGGVEDRCVEPDLLDLCHLLFKEVVSLSGGGKGYNVDLDADEDEFAAFRDWLRCYYQDRMKNLVDHNKRTIWFAGEPGKLTPKDETSRSKVARKMAKSLQNKKAKKRKSDCTHEETNDKERQPRAKTTNTEERKKTQAKKIVSSYFIHEEENNKPTRSQLKTKKVPTKKTVNGDSSLEENNAKTTKPKSRSKTNTEERKKITKSKTEDTKTLNQVVKIEEEEKLSTVRSLKRRKVFEEENTKPQRVSRQK